MQGRARGDELPEELRRRESRLERIREAKAALEAEALKTRAHTLREQAERNERTLQRRLGHQRVHTVARPPEHLRRTGLPVPRPQRRLDARPECPVPSPSSSSACSRVSDCADTSFGSEA